MVAMGRRSQPSREFPTPSENYPAVKVPPLSSFLPTLPLRASIPLAPPPAPPESRAVSDGVTLGPAPPPLIHTPVPAHLPFRGLDPATGTISYGEGRDRLRRLLEERGIQLYATRHGQSEVNARDQSGMILCGQFETPLSPLGREEANEAARQLYESLGGAQWLRDAAHHPEKLPALYASPLERAAETARATEDLLRGELARLDLPPETLARAEEAVAVRRDDRLKEIHFGDYEGRPVTELAALYPRFGKGRDFTDRFPGGESGIDVLTRLESFLTDVAGRHRDQPVLLFAHLMPVSLSGILLGQGEVLEDGSLRVDRSRFKNAVPYQLTHPPTRETGGYLLAG